MDRWVEYYSKEISVRGMVIFKHEEENRMDDLISRKVAIDALENTKEVAR